ncbi:MAG: lysophospholipid acyltransferase family protein [Pseudomonadota bacterium]
MSDAIARDDEASGKTAPSSAATARTAAELAERQKAVALPSARSNRPVTFSHRIEYGLTRAAFALFRALGVDAASNLAGGAMRRIGPMIRPISRRAEENMRHVFPEWSEAKIRQTVAGVWENLGRTAAEYPHLSEFDPEKGSSRVKVHVCQEAEERREKGLPSVLISGHFANWEVMPLVLHAEKIDYAVIYRPVNNPLVDRHIIDLRGEVMSRRMIPKGYDGARDAMAQLKAGRCVAMLADQKLNTGIPATLLGRNAMTPTAAARLAIRFKVPVFPSAIVRTGGARFEVFMRDAIKFEPTGHTGNDVATLTQLINDAMSREIEAHPEQWLWFHRRWPKEDVAVSAAARAKT